MFCQRKLYTTIVFFDSAKQAAKQYNYCTLVFLGSSHDTQCHAHHHNQRTMSIMTIEVFGNFKPY